MVTTPVPAPETAGNLRPVPVIRTAGLPAAGAMLPMRDPASHPLPVLAVLLGLAAGQVRGSDTGATLINATGQDWRIRTVDFIGTPTPVLAGLIRLDWKRDVIQEIGLKPLSALRLAHDRTSGAPAHKWFEIISVPEPGGTEEPIEGYLYFRTDRSWLGWGPERTQLSGAFYADGRPSPYRWTQAADAELWIEPISPAAPG